MFCQGRRLRLYRAETLVSPKFHLRCNLADEGRNSPGNMGRNFRVLPKRAESLALRGGDSGPNIFPPHEHHADGRRNFPGSSGPEYFRWGRSLRPPSGISGLGAESPPPRGGVSTPRKFLDELKAEIPPLRSVQRLEFWLHLYKHPLLLQGVCEFIVCLSFSLLHCC